MLIVVPTRAVRPADGDQPMVNGTFEQQSIFDGLAWMDMTRTSGALRVAGPQSGAIFFAQGLVYFGMVDGHKLGVEELARAGLTRDAWTVAGADGRSDRTFAEKLVDAGASPEAVRTFVWNRIFDVVSTFASLRTGEFVSAPGRHGFGATVTFHVDEVTRAVRRTLDANPPVYGPASTVTLRPAEGDVKVTADDWNTLIKLIPPVSFGTLAEATDGEAADRLVTALAAEGLVSVTDLEAPRRVTPPPPPPVAPPPAPSIASPPPPGAEPPEPTLLTVSYDFGGDGPGRPRADRDPELPETFAVGRDTYAAMAGIRTTSTTDHDTTTKTSALRRLIDAVRGL